jgi:hypothetical protein
MEGGTRTTRAAKEDKNLSKLWQLRSIDVSHRAVGLEDPNKSYTQIYTHTHTHTHTHAHTHTHTHTHTHKLGCECVCGR